MPGSRPSGTERFTRRSGREVFQRGKGFDGPGWKIRPRLNRMRSFVQVTIEESLPAFQSIQQFFQRALPLLIGFCILLQVEHPVTTPVG